MRKESIVADFNSAAVRFGKPGKLYIAPLGTTEPTTVIMAWPAGWVPLGYTDEGSSFNYEISTDNVEVAEELDVLARVTTGRDASVEFALAEITYRNLTLAFNGGIIEGDGTAWSFEPPDLGSETRVMLGWDALPTVASNDLRMVFRQCLQGGSLGLENRKGAAKATISANFQLEKPATGAKLLKIMGGANLNPDES
jgi:hypothetical protein